jgi:hypothetical protein
MIFKRQQPETLAEKFVRLLAFDREMVVSSGTLIDDFKRAGNTQMALWNYSHLIHYRSCSVAKLWRSGQDPRPDIIAMYRAYLEMIAYRAESDPDQAIPMAEIAGITDWDMVYSAFWMIGEVEPFVMGFPGLLGERYFAYSHYLLHRLCDQEVPAELAAAVAEAQSTNAELVDLNFRDHLMLLGEMEADLGLEAIARRIVANWPKRRRSKFYESSAPYLAGYDLSNDLSVDYQLGCVLQKIGLVIPENPHAWRWS